MSDLHIGVAEPFGFPTRLEPTLAGLISSAASRGAIVILNGDVLDVGLGELSVEDILGSVPRVREALVRACELTEVYYVVGNHDPPIPALVRALGWAVVERLLFDDGTLFTHGHELDEGLKGSTIGRYAHVLHRVERAMGSDFEFPLRKRGSMATRAVASVGLSVLDAVTDHAPTTALATSIRRNVDYFSSLEEDRDPSHVLAALSRLELPSIRRVVCGHTHKPGSAMIGDVEYVNLGTWNARLATFATISLDRVTVRDAVSNQVFGLSSYEDWSAPSDLRERRRGWKSLSVRDTANEWLDKAMGSAFAWAPSLPALAFQGTTTPLAEEAGAADDDDEVRFAPRGARLAMKEVLSGTLRLFDAKESMPIHLRLDAQVNLGASDRSAELVGRVGIPGWIESTEAHGTLRVGSDLTLQYVVHLTGPNGPIRLEGRKALRLFDIVASFRELPLAVIGPSGEPIGEADLMFDVRAELGGLVRSLAFVTPKQQNATATQQHADALGRVSGSARRSRRVVVTGASGHLGYHLVAQLMERGHEVVALCRAPSDSPRLAHLRPLVARGLTIRRGDVLSASSLRMAFQGADAIVHAAAGFHVTTANATSAIVRPTVDGVVNVLRAVAGTPIERVVMTSSVATLGLDATGREPLDENDWASEPEHPYHRAKLIAERKAWDIAKRSEIDLVVINPASFMGPNFFVHTATTRMLTDFVRGRIPVIPPFHLSWIDVRDVATLHVLALENPTARGRYPAATRHASFEELGLALAKLDPDVELPRRRLPQALNGLLPIVDRARSAIFGTRATLPESLLADLAGCSMRVSSRRAQEELGWEPLPFEQTMADTLNWIRDHYDGIDLSTAS